MNVRAIDNQTVHLRPFVRRDLPEMLAIEEDSFVHPWPQEAFVEQFRGHFCKCRVAELADRIVGYVVYLAANPITILNLAVAAEVRRRGVGSAMIDQIKSDDEKRRRKAGGSLKSIELVISEKNGAGQVFFRANGFRATGVLGEWHADGQDGYEMVLAPN